MLRFHFAKLTHQSCLGYKTAGCYSQTLPQAAFRHQHTTDCFTFRRTFFNLLLLVELTLHLTGIKVIICFQLIPNFQFLPTVAKMNSTRQEQDNSELSMKLHIADDFTWHFYIRFEKFHHPLCRLYNVNVTNFTRLLNVWVILVLHLNWIYSRKITVNPTSPIPVKRPTKSEVHDQHLIISV
jgi:hypothetical protein